MREGRSWKILQSSSTILKDYKCDMIFIKYFNKNTKSKVKYQDKQFLMYKTW